MGASWRASGPRWPSLRGDILPMITLFPSQGDFCATASDQFDVAAAIGDTFREYLERAARLHECDQWSAWLADAVAHTTFSAAVAVVECNRAWSLSTQGHTAEAIRMLDALIKR